uniref:Novel immune-type receptor 3, related 1-like n=1 Tax=Sander lucioperca TaxID=283035 RepID=A0A8D0AST1_SANLU
MKRTIFLLFLCTAVERDLGEHIFVPTTMPWLKAQTYCIQHYTDLSFVSSQSDVDKLLTAAGAKSTIGWIGLHRDYSNITGWKWSGGGYITYKNWAYGQPDNYNKNETYGHILHDGKWNDDKGTQLLPFYCINITVTGVKKSWEKALEHCRERNTDLTSLLSETESILAQKEIHKAGITERVWIGLRYLEDHWLWVNGDLLEYEAWPKGGDQDHQCPIRNRCGALTKEGLWENWECGDKLNFICH